MCSWARSEGSVFPSPTAHRVKLTCWHAAHGPPVWKPSLRLAPEAHRPPPPWMKVRRTMRPAPVDTPPLSPAGRSASPPPPPSTARIAAAWTETSRLGSNTDSVGERQSDADKSNHCYERHQRNIARAHLAVFKAAAQRPLSSVQWVFDMWLVWTADNSPHRLQSGLMFIHPRAGYLTLHVNIVVYELHSCT